MKKRFVLSSFFIFLFSLFVKNVSAARTYYGRPLIDIDFPDVFTFLNLEINLPGSYYPVPLWGFLVSMILVWALFFLLLRKIHLFGSEENRKIAITISIVLTLIVLFTSPIVDWILGLITFAGWLFTVIFVGLLIWAAISWAHSQGSEFAGEWSRDATRRRETMAGSYERSAQAHNRKATSKHERRLFKRGMRIARRELKNLQGIKQQIRALEGVRDDAVLNREKTRVINALRGILRYNRLETRVTHLVEPARRSGDRVVRDKARDLVSRTRYLQKIIYGIIHSINDNNFPGAEKDIDEADDQLTVLLRNLEDLEERVGVGRYGP